MSRFERALALSNLLGHVSGHLSEGTEMAYELHSSEIATQLHNLNMDLLEARSKVVELLRPAPQTPHPEHLFDRDDVPF